MDDDTDAETKLDDNEANADNNNNNNNNNEEKDKVEPEYEQERIVIDGRIALEVWSVVPPPLEYLAQLSRRRQEISGRQVWTGSLVLAHLLCRHHDQDPTCFQEKRILELGSGTGVLGMVVAKLCDSSSMPVPCIALTDGDELAISLLDKNLKNRFNEISSEVTKSRMLLWGHDPSTLGSRKYNLDGPGSSKSFEHWCRREWINVWEETEPIQFDLLLAGDVLYKEELPKLFFETVDRYMAQGPLGVLLLCHVPRASVSHDVVLVAAQQAGFQIKLHWKCEDEDHFTLEGCPIEDIKRANVYKISRRRV